MESDAKKTQCTQKRVCSLRLCMLTILQFSSPCRPRKRDTPSDNTSNTLGQKFMFKRQKRVKVKVSVCVQEEIWSKNAEIFDNVNLNPDIFADGTFIPIVNKFVYLGSYLTRDCRDDMDVKERIYAAGSMAGAWWKSSRGTILTPRYGTSLPRIEENGISLLVNYSFILSILLQRCESYIFYLSIYMGLFPMLG